MPIRHKFYDLRVSARTQTLIIGTFNPDVANNSADFFYGRAQNHLWRILPSAFGEGSLKNADKSAKLDFCARHKIDFIDLIEEIGLDYLSGFEDKIIDCHVTKWRDIFSAIDGAPELKKICLTRKSFGGARNIEKRWLEVENRYKDRLIAARLITPSRFYDEAKQKEWNAFLL
ncbi:MAG: hypothetical protein LBF86_04325 [Helicobacteraceae bacterium]|jgi:hypothetical protein|nr:hypothetical protein [Helicobacteraceae bacterium]